jgi:hypothetical protein
MQIELIGCTGAGKTTLASGIVDACRATGSGAWLADDFVLTQVRLDWVSSRLARTLLVDAASLLACLLTLRANRRFFTFAIRVIAESPEPWYHKLNLTRNVLKKVGIYELVRRLARAEEVVVVDEGTLHAAHNLFVHVSGEPNEPTGRLLLTFVRLVPLPDVAVYVTQNEDVLIARTLERGHRRIPDCSFASVARFVGQAVRVFDELARQPAIETRLIVLDGNSGQARQRKRPGDPVLCSVSEMLGAGLQAMASRTRERTLAG